MKILEIIGLVIIYIIIGRFTFTMFDYKHIKKTGMSLWQITKKRPNSDIMFGMIVLSGFWPIVLPIGGIIFPIIIFIANIFNKIHNKIISNAYPKPEKSTGTPFRDNAA